MQYLVHDSALGVVVHATNLVLMPFYSTDGSTADPHAKREKTIS